MAYSISILGVVCCCQRGLRELGQLVVRVAQSDPVGPDCLNPWVGSDLEFAGLFPAAAALMSVETEVAVPVECSVEFGIEVV